MSELKEKIESRVKDTIGYAEAENKKSFMVGVSVAFYQAEEYYSKEIENLKKQVEIYKSYYQTVNGDMKALTRIIDKYSNND